MESNILTSQHKTSSIYELLLSVMIFSKYSILYYVILESHLSYLKTLFDKILITSSLING